MQYILDGKTAKLIDEYSIKEIGIPSLVLMERAALSVTDTIIYSINPHNCLILAGSGNNGADGLAVARQLTERNVKVTVLLTSSREGSEEYRLQLDILKKMAVDIIYLKDAADISSILEKGYDCIVDAMYGIGLSRDIEDTTVIDAVNAYSSESKTIVVSVDLPSGIDSTDGKVRNAAVRADITVTFGYNKLGNVLYPGAGYANTSVVTNIGFANPDGNEELLRQISRFASLKKDDLAILRERKRDGNKGDFGKVLIVAGSDKIGGCASLSGKAAYSSGAGYVKVFTHEANREGILSYAPECLIDTYSMESDTADIDLYMKDIAWCDSIVIGPGIGISEYSKKMLMLALESKKMLLIDADALSILAEYKINLADFSDGNIIITPHVGEMSRLTGKPVKDIKASLIDTALNYARDNKVICVLKDARSVITDGRESYINLTGNSGMSTAGSGDVLTGIAGALLANKSLTRNISLTKLAALASFIHGSAGETASKELGEVSMSAGDIISYIHEVIR